MRDIRFVLAVLLMTLLLCRPDAAALGALNAMVGWATTVAPAMFPFMALLPMLTAHVPGGRFTRRIGRVTERFYRLPGSAVPVLAAAMLGGSPTGALAARRAPGLNRGQMKRLALSACGWSPAFLVGGVGAGMLGDAALGHVLLRAQLATQLLTPLLLRGAWREDDERMFPLSQREIEQPIRGAILAILTVCGWMTLFGALGSAAGAVFGEARAMPVLCLVDAITGLQRVARLNMGIGGKLCVIGALCGLGGGCIALQNLSVLRPVGVKVGEYAIVRLLAAGEMAAFTWLQQVLKWEIFAIPKLNPFAMAALCASILTLISILSMKKTNS